MTIEKKYLSLLRKSLLNQIYLENELRIKVLDEQVKRSRKVFQSKKVDYKVLHHVDAYFPQELNRIREERISGRHISNSLHHLVYAHSMIGEKRMLNIEHCLDKIREDNIPGDVIECGVWQGGATIFMQGYLDTYQMKNRTVWVADSFEGLPKPSHKEDQALDFSKDIVPGLAVSLEKVKQNFKSYDLLSENVKFLKGWFKDTLHKAPIEQLALIRLDGDLYESSMDGLRALYPKLATGGFIIIDDYGLIEPCKMAVSDYRQEHGITEEIIDIDGIGAFWRKTT